ncbi:MAG: methyltransferase domain-containing protein [Bryobacteraceae bacterium]
MVCTNGRIIREEWLDLQTPERAAASLNDLVKINRLLGGHGVLRETMAGVVRPEERFTLLDVGAASGDMGASVKAAYPGAEVTSFDYKPDHLVKAAHPRVCGDAFQMPFRPGSFDIVHCSLFLHHFENDRVVELLRTFAALARRAVVLTDLERHPLAYYFLPLTTWIFGWDAITLHDGPISVEAGFHAKELESLAREAGLRGARVVRHRPAFRLALTASVGIAPIAGGN